MHETPRLAVRPEGAPTALRGLGAGPSVGESWAAHLRRARRLLSGATPPGLEVPGLVRPEDAGGWATGTTVPEVAARYVSRPDGLLVPAPARPPSWLDDIGVYLTASELGYPPDPTLALRELQRIPLVDVVGFVAMLFSRMNRPGVNRRQLDLELAEEWFIEPARTQVLNLLRYGEQRVLAAPQLGWLLLKLACACSPDAMLPGVEPGSPVTAMLVLADFAGLGTDVDGFGMVRHIIANQALHAELDIESRLGRFVRRWRQLPHELAGHPRVVDLEAAFLDATGVALTDFMSVGAALWSATAAGTPRVLPEWWTELGLAPGVRERLLQMTSLTTTELREHLFDEGGRYGYNWAISTVERYPLVWLEDDSVLVLDHNLLVRRFFGWHPLFDIHEAWSGGTRAQHRRLSQVEGTVRFLTEVYVGEVVASIARHDLTVGRVFDDEQLRAAFGGRGRQVTDLAVELPGAWLVAEVTTSQLQRATAAAADEQALHADLDKLVGKAAQIDATITDLRRRPDALGRHRGSRFYPMLVLPEGFPVSAVSLGLLRQRVHAAGLLAGGGVAPLEVVDVTELEMLENLAERGLLRLRDLLDAKSRGWQDRSLRNFLLLGTSLKPLRPARLDQLWQQALDPALDRLRPAA